MDASRLQSPIVIHYNNHFGPNMSELPFEFHQLLGIIFPLLFFLSAVAGIGMILWGGILILASRGETEMITKGFQMIKNSIT